MAHFFRGGWSYFRGEARPPLIMVGETLYCVTGSAWFTERKKIFSGLYNACTYSITGAPHRLRNHC